MTVSPDAPSLQVDNVADAIQALRDAGLRLSTPRRLVIEALFAADGPVSAVHLAQKLSIDESSVYRNLEVLEQHGLIRHVHLGHSPGLYVLVSSGEVEYLYCERCAKVSAVTPDVLDSIRAEIKDRLGYAARFTHFAIVGVCRDCDREQPQTRAAAVGSGPATERAHHDESGSARSGGRASGHEHLHSHGDHVHSHPHKHPGGNQHTH